LFSTAKSSQRSVSLQQPLQPVIGLRGTELGDCSADTTTDVWLREAQSKKCESLLQKACNAQVAVGLDILDEVEWCSRSNVFMGRSVDH